MYSNNSKLTESRSPPPLIAVGKMRPDLALQEINQARSLSVQAIGGCT